MIPQEEEFLKNNISKIASLSPCPDILVVEKTVSRLAQEYLLQAGITLVFNVKLVWLNRIFYQLTPTPQPLKLLGSIKTVVISSLISRVAHLVGVTITLK